MRKLIFTLFVVLLAGAASAQTTIYSEDFTGQDGKGYNNNNGLNVSNVNWTIDLNGQTPAAFEVDNGKFRLCYRDF